MANGIAARLGIGPTHTVERETHSAARIASAVDTDTVIAGGRRRRRRRPPVPLTRRHQPSSTAVLLVGRAG